MPPISDERPLPLFNKSIEHFIHQMEQESGGDVNMFPEEEKKEVNYSKPNVNQRFDILNLFVKYFTNYITSTNLLSDSKSDAIMNEYLKIIKIFNQFSDRCH